MLRTNWLIGPLVTGRANSLAPRDGRISSILFVCNIITFTVVFNIVRWMTTGSQSFEIVDTHIFVILSIFTLSACCIMFGFLLVGKRYVLWRMEDKSSDGQAQAHFTLDLVGVYIFGIGVVLLEMFCFFSAVECLAVSRCLPNAAEYVSELIFCASRLFFTLLLMLFLGRYSRATLHNCVVLRYALLIILSVNLMTWFFTLLDDSKELFNSYKNGSDIYSIHCNVSDSKTTEFIWQCINHTTPWRKSMIAAEPVLYPFSMEFSLVASNILYHIWASMKRLRRSHGRPQASGKLSERSKLIEKDDADNKKQVVEETEGENESPLSIDVELNMSSSVPVRTPTQKNMVAPQFGFGLVIGVFMMTVMIAVSLLQQKGVNPDFMLRLYYVTKILHYAIMTILCWVGFELIRCHDYEHRPYAGEDALIVVSAVGEFAYMYFKAMAAIGLIIDHNYHLDGDIPTDVPWLLITEKILTCSQIWTQTTFLIEAARHKPRLRCRGVRKLREIMIWLLFCNLGFWVQSAFIDMLDYSLTLSEKAFYNFQDQWAFIMRILLPVCIFYRFHSAIMCYAIYGNFKKPPASSEGAEENFRVIANAGEEDFHLIDHVHT